MRGVTGTRGDGVRQPGAHPLAPKISPLLPGSAPDSISHGVVKPCRSRRSKSKNVSIKQWGGTMLPRAVASLYLGHPGDRHHHACALVEAER